MSANALIDLRSDTVTKPSAAMRAAMAAAEVGDDVYREDPTVAQLERETAAALGKEAALFVPSGSMGNLVSVLAQANRGEEAIVGDLAHIFYSEAASATAFGGVQLRTIPNHAGALDPDEVERAIRPRDIHFPRTALVCLENTHNRGGGRPLTLGETQAVTAVARRHGIKVHLDGSRIFNAAVALGVPASALCADADSVNICFSKGLGAPIGSAAAGSAEFVETARKVRKMAGGGMRQAGVIAAAALIALCDGPGRLHEDHANAKLLAERLASSGDFEVDPGSVQTNIVVFNLRGATNADGDALVAAWREAGVLAHHIGAGRFRAVTHLDVTTEQVRHAAEIMITTASRRRGAIRV